MAQLVVAVVSALWMASPCSVACETIAVGHISALQLARVGITCGCAMSCGPMHPGFESLHYSTADRKWLLGLRERP